jgi:hypothetical protein
LVLALAAGVSASPDELRQQAEAAFRAGLDKATTAPADARQEFRRAARLYDQLRQSGVRNVALARSMGNAALLADEFPLAILAFREGLRLAPNDPGLRAGLGYARREVAAPGETGLGRPPTEHRPPWLPRWPWLWLVLAWSLSAGGWLLLAAGWIRAWAAGRTLGGLFLFAALFPFLMLVLEVWSAREEARTPLAVVARDGSFLRRGNGESYPAASDTPLRGGTETRVLHERGDWLQVELSEGEVGWLPRRAVLLGGP